MVAGGTDFPADNTKDTVFIYDATADSWSAGTAMSSVRSHHTCKLITDANGDKKVLAVGGVDGAFANQYDMDMYDVATQTWSLGMLTNRYIYQLNVLILFDTQ